MGEARRGYLSYLLWLWQASVNGELVWRALLESPHTGERLGFADVGNLLAFLDAQTGGASGREATSPGSDKGQSTS